MSTRRRPGSWQDEVAKSFSRFFSRSPSQDKEEDGAGEEPERSDRSLSRFFSRGQSQDRGQSQEEQERSPSRLSLRKDSNGGARGPHEEQDRGQSQEEQERSPSRLSLRKDSNGGARGPQEEQDRGQSQEEQERSPSTLSLRKDSNGGARGPQEEEDRARGFSRTSSQEEQGEEQHRHEEKDSNLAPDIHESLSSGQTEEVKEDRSSSPPLQVTSESEEEKDTEYSQNSKVLDSEKQSRENFFHFIGNLFHFSPKTSLGNAKQVDSTQDLCKEHEDTQVKNNLDKEDSHQEHTQEVSASETEQTAEFSPAQAGPSVESNTEISKETIKQEQQETPPSRPKLNGYPQEAPAVTYGTYRGSRRIRKLLKRRADINSPIPEREEISEKETSITGDVGMENHDLLHDIVSMEPVTCRSSEEEMPPSKMLIKMKMQPKVSAATQNGESNSQVEVLEKNAEGSSVVSIVTKTAENNLHKDEDLKKNAEDGSIVSVLSQNGEYNLHKGEDLKQNAEAGSVVFVSNCKGESNLHNVDVIQKPEVISMMSVSNQKDESFSDKVEDLKENVEENSSVLWSQEPNFIERTTILEDIEESTKESPKIYNNVQIHAEKRSDMSVDLSLDNMNSSNISKEFVPNSEKNANISKDLQPKAEKKSSCSAEPVSTALFKISSDLLPNPEISEHLPVNAETNLNSSEVLQLKINNKLNLNSDLSPQIDNSSNISVYVQENSEKELKMLEDLQPNDLQKNSVESMPISGDVQRKEEEKILETFQPSKDESPKSEYELKQVFEKSSETAEENVMDFKPIATENTKTVKTSENVSLLPNHLHFNSKEHIEIQENWQVIPENSTGISVDPCLKDLKLADSSQSLQENSSSNVTEDLQTNTSSKKELREHQSEQTYIKKHLEKVEEKLERLVNSVGAISESKLNTGRPLTSEKDPTQEAAFNAKSNFDNRQRSTKENAPLIEVENLRGKEELKLNVQKNKSISEQSQHKVEEMPKITVNLQPYENMHFDIQKDFEQNTDENCKLEEANTKVISESTVGPTIQSRDTEQDIFTNGNFTEKDNLPNGQVKSMTMDKKIVNAQSSLKVSEEPQTMANEIPMIIEQQQKNVEICDDTLNEFNMAPLANNDTSGTILVNENAQGSMSDVKPVPETFLNEGSSDVAEPARTASFDNGIECQSPSPTISGSPCSSDCIDIRFDSPLPLSDAIDSGMVSSQAYTPEEQMTIKIFPPELFNKSISVPFNIDQEDKRTEHVGSKIENVENPLLASPILHNAVKTQNEPLTEETESRTGANSSTRVFLEDSGVADMYEDVSGRLSTNDRMKVNVNSDVYVAKVSVKSVNIEEVKLPPFEFHSDIVSIAKVESATFEKELVCFPNSSPPPLKPEYNSKFKDSNFTFQQDEQEENIVTNSEVPSDINEKDLTVNNVNLPFNESSQFLDCNNYEKSPHSCYMEAERFPALNKINVAENVVNLFSNDYVGDNIPQHTFLEKGLPVLPDKSSDVLIENLKNNNLTIDTSDDIINISLQTNTSENDLTNESLMSDDSHWELQSCDSLSEFHPNGDLTYKEPVKEKDIILQSTFQRDINFTDDINSSDFATSKIALPSTDHSELSTELFEKKANEIILSVLHTAIDEFQNLNKNHVNALSLGTVKETLAEKMMKDYSSEDEAEAPEKSRKNMKSLTTDPFISIVASGLVNDVINSSKQYMQSSLDKNVGTNNSCTQTSMVSVNGPEEDTTNPKNETIFLLGIDSPVLFSSYEVNSNVLLPTPSGSVEGTRENNGFKRVEDTEDILNDSSYLDGETVIGQDDSYTNLEAMIQGDTENKNVTFDLGLDGDQGGFYSKSLETEGSMNTPFINNLLGENMCVSGTDEIDPFQFSLYNSKYVEIESDDEEEYDDNEHSSATDLFLTVPSRRVKIYPFSLSPIYEDDSSCEDAASSNSSPRHKLGTTGSGSNDPTSILSLLQSVSDRLKEANIEEMCFGGNLTFLSEAATFSALDNTDASGTRENMPAPTKSNIDAQKMLLEETTPGGKKSGLFITKAENKVNSGSGRQSLFLNLASQSSTVGATSSVENSPKATAENEPSPSTPSESSSIQYKDLSPDVAPVTPLSPLQMVTDSGFSSLKPEIKCQPRMSSQSVYYQYFHSSQNYSHSKENKESPTEEKVDLPTKKESKETEDDLLTSTIDSSCLKFNPRPGKVILSDVVHHENKIELNGDALDATSWVFPNGVNIRVIRGCWILYEKPHFEGQAHVLEEGEAVLLHLWDAPGARAKPDQISIGSVKRVVKDYFPEVIISPLEDTSDSPVHIHTEVPSLEHLVDKRPRSLTVNSGVWLTYKEPQYNGAVSVLEEGCDLPQIQACGVKSMRPLKMGGLKVQLPNDPKIIIYEKPHFQGWSREITEHVSSIGKLISDEDNTDPLDVGSIRVVGGIWVCYEKERYKGYQYLLEEGEYEDCQAWGGYSSTFQSIRYLQANFLEASVSLLESDSEDGKHVDLFNQAIPDLELAGYNTRPQCIHVKKGMWVAYRQKHYCGEQYILEKGRYKTHVDWGGSSNTIMSIRPVLLEPLGRNEVKHLIKAYGSTNFQGKSVDFTQQVSDFISFMPKSFKVLRGCWLLGYQADACDNVCVLEEGHFPDLASCGCPAAEIKYIRPMDYVFAEPSISLFALDSCEGREMHFEEAVTSVLNKDLHFYTQSVWVRRGLWIAFEGANFLGRQMLLDSQQILNWSKFSGWKAIGSLRPLKQPAVYFMVRNRHRDKYLTVTGKLSDTRATFVSVSSRNGQSSQIWYFTRGFLKSKANDLCLDIIGGKNIPESKVSLWAEHGKTRQKWKINKDGTILSYISDDLVLDVKGGNYYDQNFLIVNRSQENALTQKWDIEIL
ncbi:very large A-kinase anchor protein [Rana temporaria]|uniref:very large A-kinase anchor protein n=1 Tax=Rana temporaria TaxID=8407 RepID=UPI001AAD1E92|nr:very large A-kinase anchor protein [Rana temporaria]